jgi:hypothetical protein
LLYMVQGWSSKNLGKQLADELAVSANNKLVLQINPEVRTAGIQSGSRRITDCDCWDAASLPNRTAILALLRPFIEWVDNI